jgi:hypothetical protein
MGLVVAVSNQAAKALPNCLRSAVWIEDDPRRLAEFLVARLQEGARGSCAEIRDAAVKYFGIPGWQKRLEEIVLRTVRLAHHAEQGAAPARIGAPSSAFPSARLRKGAFRS